MSRITEFNDLIAYTRWANERVLDATAPLSPEQFTRDMGNSFPSIRDTLVHVMSAEWVWLSRLRGESPTTMPADWKSYEHEQVRARWAEVARALEQHVGGLGVEDLDRVIEYTMLSGQPSASSIAEILRHVVNHSTYHRGQVTTMLRQLGASAPTTDLIAYYRTAAPRVVAP